MQKVVGELYGPLMVVFTLIAVLLYGMKDSGHTVVSTNHLKGSSNMVKISKTLEITVSVLTYLVGFVLPNRNME